jgi:hypothetical protein
MQCESEMMLQTHEVLRRTYVTGTVVDWRAAASSMGTGWRVETASDNEGRLTSAAAAQTNDSMLRF